MGDSSTASCDGWDSENCRGTRHCPPRCPRFVDSEGTALVIRQYRPTDREALVAMYEDLDPQSRTMGLPPSTQRRLDRWLDSLTIDGWSLVAETDDDIVGHVGVTAADAEDPHFVVFVHQAYRNRGIGSELLRQTIAYADEWGHRMLMLTVSTDNDRAVALYDNLGFDVRERTRSQLEMQLSLDLPISDSVKRPPAERGTE